MQKIYLSVLLSFPFLGFAQNNEGRIIFEEKVKIELNFKMEGVADSDAVKAMIPKEHKSQKELTFNDKVSLFKNYKEESTEKVVTDESENMNIKMVFSMPDEQVFTDLARNEMTESHDLFGRTFLIKKEIPKKAWKILNEQKDILGFHCQKAILKDSASATEAWFTTAIPVSTAPMGLSGLPGMVLELTGDKGKLSILAKEIKLEKNTSEILPPAKGKTVTEEEFKKIAKEKAKEMMEEMGGNGNQVIIKSN